MSWSSHSRVKCICQFRGGGNTSKPSLNQFLRLTPERCDQKSFREWEQPMTEMGCAPSKSAVVYSEEKMCRDWDTCSTFVPNLPSFVSPPDKPQRSDESSSGGQTFSNGELFLQIPKLSCFLECIHLSRFNIVTVGPFPSSSGAGGEPWLQELRGPGGSRCSSGSAQHEFESLTFNICGFLMRIRRLWWQSRRFYFCEGEKFGDIFLVLVILSIMV